MRRLAAVTVALLVLLPGGVSDALPKGTKLQTYKGGLSFPVDMAWVRGTNKIFFTEKNTGNVRVMKGQRLLSRPCAHLNVNGSGERGAMGIALDPHFKHNHRLYVYYTNASPLQNRVIRFVVHHHRCTHGRNIVKGLSASSSGYHNGGQLEFVRRKLFVSVGEAHDPSNAQSTSSRLGKILRINTDGSIPKGNPFSRPGHRAGRLG